MKQKTTHGLKNYIRNKYKVNLCFYAQTQSTFMPKNFKDTIALVLLFLIATSMGEYAFDQCAIIRTLYCSLLTIIPKFGVSHCPYLQDIDFNNVVEIKDHAFTQSGIQECYFPSATTLGHCVFESCTNLNIAYLPKVTTMGDNVFKGCNQLKWLLLPNIISKERIRLGILIKPM